jgi:PAS domain S-box-containing protein
VASWATAIADMPLATPDGRRSCVSRTGLPAAELLIPTLVSHAPPDASLAGHLERIKAYIRDSGLLRGSRDQVELRRDLAAFIEQRTPAVLGPWMGDIGRALGIPERDWPQLEADQAAAITRWARHIADPDNIETYVFLRRHARRGFISHFPPSRFLVSQMRFIQYLTDDLHRLHANDPARGQALAELLTQEFRARMLHITDLFVEAREEELLEQEASYRRAIDRAPGCIVMADARDGRVFDLNQGAETLLGWPRTALAGRLVVDLFPEPERPRAEALWRSAITQGHAAADDLHLVSGDGRLIPTFVNAGFIEYGDRRWVQLMCIDLSERQRLEGQLIQSEKMAAIGQLAAGIAHELRNPLAIVMNALWHLRQLVDGTNPEVKEDLGIAEEEIVRAQAIIKSLLEFSRESGAELERVDVNDLLTRTLQLLGKYLQNHGVRVTTEFQPTPPCVANANAMRQILLNLITNAVQAMPDGGALLLRTGVAGADRVRLEVHDTGIGIPANHLQDIFNPFYTTKAPGQGTGLGLSVVHSIVQRYRGDIRVTSTVGAGTTFTIELPCPCHDASAPEHPA